jgi:hypothetical protein
MSDFQTFGPVNDRYKKRHATYKQRVTRWLCKGRRKLFETLTLVPYWRREDLGHEYYSLYSKTREIPTTVYVARRLTVTAITLSQMGL